MVPIVNLPGFAGEIAFTPEALAGIYLGKIKKWNDPILKQANRGTSSSGSGHRGGPSGGRERHQLCLDRLSFEDQPRVEGANRLRPGPKWPVGRAATGNDGVAKLVKELGGSIGYVEFIYALQNHLSFGKVRNRNGEFVEASLESIAIAAGQSIEIAMT